MKFILSRTNDYRNHSKKWILGHGLLFWLISRIFAMLLLMGCIAIYNAYGINPESLTKFAGSPEKAKTMGSLTYALLTIGLAAPIFEEGIFRLGLSFKKWQVALAVTSIPAYLLWQHINSANLTIASASIYLFCMVATFSLIYFLTTDSFWEGQKKLFYNSTIWISAIAFGLIHLIAFTSYSWVLFPYMLCVITVPFFAGCAITYYRVNLGFWWGVGLHIFNNLPALLIMLLQ